MRGIPHDPERVLHALARREAGATLAEIARESGLPRATVARWCRGLVPAGAVRLRDGTAVDRCGRCGGDAHGDPPRAEYAYLLGIYLGDGALGRSGRAGRTIVLRIVMDEQYPGIIEEVIAAIVAVRGRGPVSTYRPPGQACVALSAYTQSWLCLFPQHGKGPKHLRSIALEPWQQEIVDAEPGRFLRGLIHSDGWRGVNRVRVKGRDYAYPRYQFSNRSADIRGLFTAACDRLGVEWRPWGRFHISVARRASVALLDEHIGPKS